MILSSIILGVPNRYNINGQEINFVNDAEGVAVFGNTLFGRVVDLLLSNKAFSILTFGYLHVFIHEMGHVCAGRLQGDNPRVYVYTKTCRGRTQ
jgi:hypothetical protein